MEPTMREWRRWFGLRMGRVFSTRGLEEPRPVLTPFIDEDDRARDRRLRKYLSERRYLKVMAHPGTGESTTSCHEAHVFFHLRTKPGLRSVFACVVISRTRLAEVLHNHATMAETYTLQIADYAGLDSGTIENALHSWLRRNYPEVPAQTLNVEMYDQPTDRP